MKINRLEMNHVSCPYNPRLAEVLYQTGYIERFGTGTGEMSRQQIMEIFELKHLPNFRSNYLFPAEDSGYIEMTLPDKPKSKNQKYKLTKKGMELKNILIQQRKNK